MVMSQIQLFDLLLSTRLTMVSSVLTLRSILITRHAHAVTGLPDAYSRGRIIGVYARLALYGCWLLDGWESEWLEFIDEETIRLREECMQYQALAGKLLSGWPLRYSSISAFDTKKLSMDKLPS